MLLQLSALLAVATAAPESLHRSAVPHDSPSPVHGTKPWQPYLGDGKLTIQLDPW